MLEAELQAILAGTQLLHARGFSNINMESDSLLAVRLIQHGCATTHPHFGLVKEIQQGMQRLRDITISHILREGNKVADGLAKFGANLDDCSRLFLRLPSFVSIQFHADMMGIVFPRGF